MTALEAENLSKYVREVAQNLDKNLSKTGPKKVYFNEITKNQNFLLLKKSALSLNFLLSHLKEGQYSLVKNEKLANDAIISILCSFLNNPCFCSKQILKENYNLSEYEYRRIMEHLYKNRWLILEGRKISLPNPFLEFVFRDDKNWENILAYYQYDFFDLLNVPLLLAKEYGAEDLEIYWFKYRIRKAYFEGIVHFQFTVDNISLSTSLPINIHYAGANPHITLPIKREIFGIKDTKRVISEIIIDNKVNKIHLDNSISLSLPFKSASWMNWRIPYMILRNVGKISRPLRKKVEESKLHLKEGNPYFHKIYQADYDFMKKYWDGQGHDYVEFNNPEAFEGLMRQNLSQD